MRRVPPGAPILTADAMRAAEAAALGSGISQAELMARAGMGVAREVHRHVQGRAVLVLAGPGNNGGDAYVAARLLSQWGHDVMVAALGEAREGAAAEARHAWRGPVVALADAPPRAVLVDGVFGTGLTRAIEPSVASILERLRAAARFCVAIDLPSGIDSDHGVPTGHVLRADVTAALGALKPSHLLGVGASCSGHVSLVDLRIAVSDRWTTLARPQSLRPERTAHKFTRGLALVVGGAMAGAARLSAAAALRGGAGYVVLAGTDVAIAPLDAIVSRQIAQASDLEAFLSERPVDALCIGPGLGRDERAQDLLVAAIDSEVRLLIDGDALSLLGENASARLSNRSAPTVLTPHGGEFDRMFGTGAGSKIDRTLAAARRCGAIVVHKGPDTVIAHPDGRVVVSAAAPMSLATAGAGDVLAGLVAGRLATGGNVWAAVAEGAWLHGRAAELAGAGLVADDLIAHSAEAMQEVW
ncbi:NAD(P)H-hydrate dehydratase [Sphingomonas sp. AX6]|uniref:NAD(P)H-hydrate dehydratase n=1 Tax=Sphingomonas sp. AX6 TaxID=2653171 RepID=UPI0012F32964|nr:NAD(P)H-hydrate dehydratase [Sphingomonas sp. AX6]VXC94827.1 NAD(P)H-hydrate epimerase,ADP-dependent (S)-NAD(P)H-hydrate dehydratase [Sphingomonas sp. AX6]